MADLELLEGMRGVRALEESPRRPLLIISVGASLFLLAYVFLVGWTAVGRTMNENVQLLTPLAAIVGGIVGVLIGKSLRREP